MPAVSTNRQVRPPSSTSSSTGSTVVPATLSTTTRSSPGELVEQRRLADVGAADDRDPARTAVLLVGDGRRLRQHREHGVQQVARAAAVQRRYGVRLAQAEVPQAVGLGLGALVVDLVGREDHRLAGAAQDLDDLLVGVGDADRRVDDEQRRVRERRPRSRPARRSARPGRGRPGPSRRCRRR